MPTASSVPVALSAMAMALMRSAGGDLHIADLEYAVGRGGVIVRMTVVEDQ